MTQLLAASDRPNSACIRGSATITMVPSSVDISCMPVIATIARPSVVASGLAGGCGELTPDMASYPTVAVFRRAAPSA